MKKAQGETAADTVKDAENAPYKPTPEEAKAIEAYRAKKERRGPRLKVTLAGKNLATVDVDHADNTVGTVALMRAIGTTDVDFLHPLLCQIVDASEGAEASESGAEERLPCIPDSQTSALIAELTLYRSPRFSRRSRALLSAFKRGLRRMLASDLVRALANRCLRDIFFVRRVAVRMVIAHLLGVTPVLAARRGPNGCRARIARCEAHDPASPRWTWPRMPCRARSPRRLRIAGDSRLLGHGRQPILSGWRCRYAQPRSVERGQHRGQSAPPRPRP